MIDSTCEEALLLPAREAALPPDEVDHRLSEVARARVEVNAHLAYWLREVQRRSLYTGFGLNRRPRFSVAAMRRSYWGKTRALVLRPENRDLRFR